jgi:hypothetical protein
MMSSMTRMTFLMFALERIWLTFDSFDSVSSMSWSCSCTGSSTGYGCTDSTSRVLVVFGGCCYWSSPSAIISGSGWSVCVTFALVGIFSLDSLVFLLRSFSRFRRSLISLAFTADLYNLTTRRSLINRIIRTALAAARDVLDWLAILAMLLDWDAPLHQLVWYIEKTTSVNMLTSMSILTEDSKSSQKKNEKR